MDAIYLDNASTTPLSKEVINSLKESARIYGNPSSKHSIGKVSKDKLELARKVIAKKIKCLEKELIFTSGGTESNNLALKGLFFANYPKKDHLIVTEIEHESILNVANWLKSLGCKVSYMKVNKEGLIDLNELEKIITKKTFLVSVIHGNNEIGTIQNLKKINEICKKKNVLLHTDACQTFCKEEVTKEHADLITINSSKINGPKGVGGLFIKEGINITPLVHGGKQEFSLRGGTENIQGIIGFKVAVENYKINNEVGVYLEKRLKEIPEITINSPENRIKNILNIKINGITNEIVINYLDSKKIYISSKSACLKEETSYVLKAIGLKKEEIESSVRISLSNNNTKKEIDELVKRLKEIIKIYQN